MNSPLNIEVSLYQGGVLDTNPVEVNLYELLTDTNHPAMVLVDAIRATQDKSLIAKLKKGLPAFTASGTFKGRTISGLKVHSGLICIDIDFKGNDHITNFMDLKTQISHLKEVVYCGLSVSGKGFWVLIRIAYPEQHDRHFKALEGEFKKWGITIDPACKDVSRLRFYSYDDQAYFNHSATVFTGIYTTDKPKQSTQKAQFSNTTLKDPMKVAVKLVSSAIGGNVWYMLRKAAFLLGGYVVTGMLTEAEACELLKNAVMARQDIADLPHALKTIQDALKAGQARPINALTPVSTSKSSSNMVENVAFLAQGVAINDGLKLTPIEAYDFINYCDDIENAN